MGRACDGNGAVWMGCIVFLFFVIGLQCTYSIMNNLYLSNPKHGDKGLGPTVMMIHGVVIICYF
jgi:hypothetical protein